MSNIGNKEVLSRNLKMLRTEHGKSRSDICQALGFKYSTYSDWENGNKYPRIDRIEMLANYFGVLKSDLIEEKSVKDRIEENPTGMAQLHFEMIMDEDLQEIFEDFKKLDENQKETVKGMIHYFANKKTEV